MAIANAIMVPHPPILLPQIGRGEERKIQATADAYARAAQFVAAEKPDALVILSPHAELYADWFHISPGRGAQGNFSAFGAPGVRVGAVYDTALAERLCALAAAENFPAGTAGRRQDGLDHGTMIPLWFLRAAYGDAPLPPVVRIGLSGLPLTQHYRLGMLIRQAAEELGRRVSVVASGDLSHRLKPDGPYGFSAEGPQYDARIMEVMGRAAFGELLDFDESFCEKAGECGHRSFTILAGCFDGTAVTAQRLSHEGTFGVGYGVCLFTPGAPDAARCFLAAAQRAEQAAQRERRAREDPYVRLARQSVETYVRTGRPAALPAGLPAELTGRRAGAFVSLHLYGRLRGCIGTISPAQENLAREILHNGVSACSEDPRFPPVTEGELPALVYSVDVLGAPEPVDSPAQLDVRRYGVIVAHGARRGLLLPDLDGVDTVEDQIAIARKKAGIRPEEAVTLQRFEVVRHV
jgi:AmmeMemoRadiSam system protein A